VEVSAHASEVAVTDSGEKSDLITSEELDHLSLLGATPPSISRFFPARPLRRMAA